MTTASLCKEQQLNKTQVLQRTCSGSEVLRREEHAVSKPLAFWRTPSEAKQTV